MVGFLFEIVLRFFILLHDSKELWKQERLLRNVDKFEDILIFDKIWENQQKVLDAGPQNSKHHDYLEDYLAYLFHVTGGFVLNSFVKLAYEEISSFIDILVNLIAHFISSYIKTPGPLLL